MVSAYFQFFIKLYLFIFTFMSDELYQQSKDNVLQTFAIIILANHTIFVTRVRLLRVDIDHMRQLARQRISKYNGEL